MRRLDEQGRSIVVLHYFLGMPLSEVATCLGLPIGTVKSRLHRSLDEMRSEAHAALPASPIAEGGQLA
jgi:RNA polymerase sigma-70 factor (ECF subfamily)